MPAAEADAPGTVRLSLTGQPPQIVLERTDGQFNLFWSRLQGELGALGRGTDLRLRVPAEVFLVRRRLIRALCEQYSVGLDVDDGATDLLVAIADEENALGRALATAAPLDAEEVGSLLRGGRFSRSLKSFQLRDVGRLMGLPHGANFSVPGAGKTTATYAVYEAERVRGRVEQLLVVAPLSAFDAWLTEAEECFEDRPQVNRFDPDQPLRWNTEVLLVNYAKLLNHSGPLASWARSRPTHLVLDEAHRMKKGRGGAWGSACLDLSWYAARRDILTGTPAPQHPRDLQALFEFLWPASGRQLIPEQALGPRPARDAGSQVAEVVKPLFVRTRKSELGLNEPTKRVLRLELHGLHRDIYLAMTSHYAGQFRISGKSRRELSRLRQAVMYLLEAATNPSLLPLGGSPADPPVFYHPRFPIPIESDLLDLLNEYGRFETPAKFRKLAELVDSNASRNRKTLIWSNFVRNLEGLRVMFARYSPGIIHGGIAASARDGETSPRQQELERFRNDPECMVLLANPAATAEGISLHHVCHDAIYLERTFNAGQYLQSVDRIHRLGLDRGQETRITFLLTKDTIDEVVNRRVEQKASLLSDMLNDPDIITMALPDEDDLEDVDTGFGQPLDDDEDVAALLAHLRGDGPIPR